MDIEHVQSGMFRLSTTKTQLHIKTYINMHCTYINNIYDYIFLLQAWINPYKQTGQSHFFCTCFYHRNILSSV